MTRALDVLGAALLLIATAPLLALAALLVRTTLGAPVLFHHRRAGRLGRPFVLHKLRTMHPPTADSDDEGARLTTVGRWLRACSIDELPQLWNVLRGDMALVGPRPLLLEYLPRYSAREARRHETRPGITGLAQVRGRNGIPWSTKLRLDVWYVDHRSLGLDLWILWRTLVVVAVRRGIAAPTHATMPAFTGAHRTPGKEHSCAIS